MLFFIFQFVIVLKGFVKLVLGIGKDDKEFNEDRSENNEEVVFLKREKDDVERRLSLMGVGKGEVLEGLDLGILDQVMINVIWVKRERFWQLWVVVLDYILLDGGSNYGVVEGLSDEESEF